MTELLSQAEVYTKRPTESTFDPDTDGGCVYDVNKFSTEAKQYYETLNELFKLNYKEFVTFFSALNLQDEIIRKHERLIREQQLFVKCEGNPDEIVFKDVTRSDIYDKFEKNKPYSFMYIAGVLGLTYRDVYNNIVPWMRRNGFKFSIER